VTEPPLGIPTVYRGIRFRSRVEATYACFFDKLGWIWEYEPLDLAGYIPDFVLRFQKPLLVEIKGAFSIDQLDPFREKIERSGWTGEALLMGVSPIDDGHPHPLLGQIGEPLENGEWLWSPARAFVCISRGHLSVLSEDNSWDCRICGVGGHGNLGVVERDPDGAFKEWALAKNRMQWRPGT
jgi:hypothetical protein